MQGEGKAQGWSTAVIRVGLQGDPPPKKTIPEAAMPHLRAVCPGPRSQGALGSHQFSSQTATRQCYRDAKGTSRTRGAHRQR